jgi:CheY-like chemotaxis protein
VRIPAVEPERGAAAGDRPGAEPLDGRTILLVDAEPSVLDLARTVLEGNGCAVLTAGNGVEALALFGHDPRGIDVVLLDLSMPTLDGRETLRALRAIRPDVRVILSSGYGATEALDEIDGRSPAGFLDKPYDPARLVGEIRRALGC